MALTKARFIAGDAGLASKIRSIIEEFVYEEPFIRRHVVEMNAIRSRMEFELARETSEAWDLKAGRGGLVDIEFMAQYRQIQENVRIPNTRAVMKRLRIGLLEEYDFLRDAESMLRLWSPHSSSRFEPKDVPALSQMLHLKDFLADYKHVTEAVRRTFEAVI
jgi:glutamate-ammonia-ligase adenylyltransferase